MRTVVLYIGMSLDGFIAGPDGNVDWMGGGQDGAAESGDAYSRFLRDVDTVVMGWNTYHQITAELSPGVWPYEGLTAYVVTHGEGILRGDQVYSGIALCAGPQAETAAGQTYLDLRRRKPRPAADGSGPHRPV